MEVILLCQYHDIWICGAVEQVMVYKSTPVLVRQFPKTGKAILGRGHKYRKPSRHNSMAVVNIIKRYH